MDEKQLARELLAIAEKLATPTRATALQAGDEIHLELPYEPPKSRAEALRAILSAVRGNHVLMAYFASLDKLTSKDTRAILGEGLASWKDNFGDDSKFENLSSDPRLVRGIKKLITG